MKTISGYEWNKTTFNGILSAVPAFVAIFCVTDIVRIGIEAPPVQKIFSVAGLIISCVAAWFLAAFFV